jgi:hypothetical protein
MDARDTAAMTAWDSPVAVFSPAHQQHAGIASLLCRGCGTRADKGAAYGIEQHRSLPKPTQTMKSGTKKAPPPTPAEAAKEATCSSMV